MLRRFLSAPLDWFLLIIPIILTVIGIITIYTITFASHNQSLAFGQIVYASLGIIIMFLVMFTDYRSLAAISWLVYLIGLLLLVPLLPFLAPKLPFVTKIFGAYRWINLGIFQLQPAEVFKLVAAVFGAYYLSRNQFDLTGRKVLNFLVLAALPIGLILLQPDLGTAAVVSVIFAGLFLAARPSRTIILLSVIMIAIAGPLAFSHLKPYQKNRIETFINPSSDPQGQGYNVRQSLIAVGSGGLAGRGFGQGSQTVLNFLPVAHTDFIFAGFAEATGFIGSVVLISLYLLMLSRIIAIARESTDRFGTLLALAVAAMLFFQTFVHIGINIGIMPVTGIPLPFMSYGGTAIIINFTLIGIIESVAIRHKKVVFRS